MYVLIIITGAILELSTGRVWVQSDQHPAYPSIQSCIIAKQNVLRTEPKGHIVVCVPVTEVTQGGKKSTAS